jgi:hypothetical protein
VGSHFWQKKQEKVKKQGSKIALKGCKIIFLNISMHEK